MDRNEMVKSAVLLVVIFVLSSCGGISLTSPDRRTASPAMKDVGSEVVMYAIALMDRQYHFGGSNPESGFDCSGMVSYVFQQAIGLRLPHSAEQMAKEGHEVNASRLSPGDLVFFNTLDRPFSHVGIYIGDNRFIHAPGQDGRIKISSMKAAYFEKRFEGARTFLNLPRR